MRVTMNSAGSWRSRVVVHMGQTKGKNVLRIVRVGVRPEWWGSHLLPEDALRSSWRTITVSHAALVAVHAVEEGAVWAEWVGIIVSVSVRNLVARSTPAQKPAATARTLVEVATDDF